MKLSISTLKVFKADMAVYSLSFLTSILIARKLGLTALGIWSVLRLISSYLECFGRIKSEAALVYFIGKKTYRKEDIFISTIFINLTILLFVYIICYSNFDNIYLFFFKNANSNYKQELNILFLSVSFQFIYINFISLFPAINKINIYNRLVVLNAFFTLILTLVCLFLTSLGVLGLCFVYLISPLICLIYAFKFLPKNFLSKGKLKFSALKDLLIYSSNYYTVSIFQELQQSGSRLITASILLPQAIAFIDQGQKFALLLQKTVSPIQVTLLPKISSSSKKKF